MTSRRPRTTWTRRFGDEYLAGCTTPLTAGLLVPWIVEEFLRDLARASGNRRAAAAEPLRLHHGHVYFDGEYLAAMLRALPRRLRRAATMGWFPESWSSEVDALRWEPWLALGMIRARLGDRRSSLRENPRALERHCRRIDVLIRPRLEDDHGTLTDAELLRRLDEACALGREHFRIIRWGVGITTPALHAVLAWSLGRLAADRDGALYRAIIAGLPGMRTADVDHGIWLLAEEARRDPPLAAALVDGSGVTAARAAHPGAPFWARLDAFLDRDGHRAPARELSLPRWREEPDAVLALVRAHLGGAAAVDPRTAVEAAIRRRLEAEATILRRAGRGPLGGPRRALLRRILRDVVVYTRHREDQRYHLDLLLLHLRLLALEMGRRLTAAGLLEDPDEVFLLEVAELRQALERPRPGDALRSVLDARRREHATWRDTLPATFVVDGVETEAEPDAAEDVAITGVGASPGRARGRARVARDVSGLGEVEADEILVTGAVDPGWTGVFPLLGGVVTETGGLLGHAAIVAREYGLPAVTGVRDATARIRTGDLLEIDGGAGWVRRTPTVSRETRPGRAARAAARPTARGAQTRTSGSGRGRSSRRTNSRP